MEKSRRKYNAKVAFRLVQEEVERKIKEGHRARTIYEDLVQAGRLPISYSTFCDYIKGHGERASRGRKPNGQEAQPGRAAAPAAQPIRPERPARSEKPSAFVHEKNIPISELV